MDKELNTLVSKLEKEGNLKEISNIISKLRDEGRFEEISNILNKRAQRFWEEIYPPKEDEEKISYWVANISKSVRTYGETFGEDPWKVINKKEYERWKKLKPRIDELLPEISKKNWYFL